MKNIALNVCSLIYFDPHRAEKRAKNETIDVQSSVDQTQILSILEISSTIPKRKEAISSMGHVIFEKGTSKINRIFNFWQQAGSQKVQLFI